MLTTVQHTPMFRGEVMRVYGPYYETLVQELVAAAEEACNRSLPCITGVHRGAAILTDDCKLFSASVIEEEGMLFYPEMAALSGMLASAKFECCMTMIAVVQRGRHSDSVMALPAAACLERLLNAGSMRHAPQVILQRSTLNTLRPSARAASILDLAAVNVAEEPKGERDFMRVPLAEVARFVGVLRDVPTLASRRARA